MEYNQRNTTTTPSGNNQTATDLSTLADTAKAKLGEVAEPVKEKAIEVAEQQKEAGAQQVDHFARAVHGAASSLETEMPQLANYFHDAGQKLEQLAKDLKSGSVDELMDKFGRYAKDQPALVFGGAVVAGFALTRFLKSSAKQTASTMQGGTA